MRKKWDKGLRLFGYLPRPYWIFNHPLFQTYKDKWALRKHGKVYYAALVQANEKMFQPIRADNIPGNPGALLYSTGTYERAPEALREIAGQLYDYKNTDKAPEAWKQIVEQISDEHSYNWHQSLDLGNREAHRIYYTPIMFFRQHLPKDQLLGSIFPIVIAPDHCRSVMVLPKRYWTKEMKNHFINGL